MALSFLRRLWQKIGNPTGFVGKDLEGNRYFEHPNPHGAFGRTKRIVKYRQGFDMWTYVAGERRLAVQWTAWLTHTRGNPPTLEELHADLERQKRVRLNAAMIEARDRKVASQIEEPRVQGAMLDRPKPFEVPRPHGADTSHNGSGTHSGFSRLGPADHTGEATSSRATQQPHSTPLAIDEPQTWAPSILRRGG